MVAARSRLGLIFIALLLPWLAPGSASALNAVGHQIVAEIAEQFLEPRAAAELHRLLALEDAADLAAIANWAEEVRLKRRDTERWHYVGIPLASTAYDAARDCRGGTCVVAKLEQFAAVLRDRAAPPRDRLEALKFVVHLVGDIHQPLQAADNGDRRGNAFIVICDGRRTNLNQLWSDELLGEADDAPRLARDLAHSVTARELREWQQGSAADWANESHAIAKGFVYRYVPQSRVLPASYEASAQPVAFDRLRRAGVRLARILNRSL